MMSIVPALVFIINIHTIKNSAFIYQPAIDYVGCGMIIQGKLYNGFSHFAGELRCLPFL